MDVMPGTGKPTCCHSVLAWHRPACRAAKRGPFACRMVLRSPAQVDAADNPCRERDRSPHVGWHPWPHGCHNFASTASLLQSHFYITLTCARPSVQQTTTTTLHHSYACTHGWRAIDPAEDMLCVHPKPLLKPNQSFAHNAGGLGSRNAVHPHKWVQQRCCLDNRGEGGWALGRKR